jgi:hypothetical protein
MHANTRAAEESAQLLKVELEQANDKAWAEAAKRADAERKQANAERDRAEANERASRLEAEMHELRQKLHGGLVGSDKWLVHPIALVNPH